MPNNLLRKYSILYCGENERAKLIFVPIEMRGDLNSSRKPVNYWRAGEVFSKCF